LAIAIVVIDPTGFLGKGKTEIPHLPLLIGHSVCLVHILTVVEEDSCSLGQWDFLTFILNLFLKRKLRLWNTLQSLNTVLTANSASTHIQFIWYVRLT
jgi:hypothetical protein